MAIKCVFDAAGDEAALIGWLRDANTGETERNVELANIENGAEPGYGYWHAATQSVKAGPAPVAATAPTTAQVTAHTQAVIDRANVTWITTGTGTLTLTENARWLDFFHWVGSAHECVTTAIAAGTYSNIRLDWLFRAYQALVPADYDSLAVWYRNHGQPIWTVYRATIQGSNPAAARAYFGATIPATDLLAEQPVPTFASDAASATAWAGAAGTIDVTVPLTWRSP